MAIVYGTTSLVLNDGVTYWYVTLDGQIPSSPTRYKTHQGAQKAAAQRQARQQQRGE